MSAGTAVSAHRMKLGAFEVTTILDGFIDLPPSVLQGDPDLRKRAMEAGGVAPAAPMRAAVGVVLLNTGAELVMVDCGGAEMLGPNTARMPQALAQLGSDPGQVDAVYITHMHGEHLHGAVTPEGAKAFPNAVLRIAKLDVDHWTSAAVHLPFPAIGKLRAREAGGFADDPLPWRLYWPRGPAGPSVQLLVALADHAIPLGGLGRSAGQRCLGAVAVGRAAAQRGGAQRGTGRGLVVNVHRLTQAGHGVDTAAGRLGRDQRDRAARPGGGGGQRGVTDRRCVGPGVG